MTTPVEEPAQDPDRQGDEPSENIDPLYGAPEEPDPLYGQPGDEPGAV